MMDSILEQSGARRRHCIAPLLKEREQYLSHLLQQGTSQRRVRSVAAYLIHIIRLMGLTTLRRVELEEIKEAGEGWANYRGPHRRRRAGRKAALCFTNVAKNWFRFHGQLAVPPAPPRPFHELTEDFVEFMRSAQGLSPDTIRGYSSRAGIFLEWLAKRHNSLSSVSLNDVDELLASKARTDGVRGPLQLRAKLFGPSLVTRAFEGGVRQASPVASEVRPFPNTIACVEDRPGRMSGICCNQQGGASPQRFALVQSYRCAPSMRFAAAKSRVFV